MDESVNITHPIVKNGEGHSGQGHPHRQGHTHPLGGVGPWPAVGIGPEDVEHGGAMQKDIFRRFEDDNFYVREFCGHGGGGV